MSQTHLFLERSAVFSPCRKYRYQLWRRWRPGPYANFICLNPSDASELIDDNTSVRIVDYADSWGYAAACITNINSFCTKRPRVMKSAPDPVGPDNDRHLLEVAAGAAIHIAAWGTHGPFNGRDLQVIRLLANFKLHCLAVTKGGHPHHPLRLRRGLRPTPFEPPIPHPARRTT
jgi:hypothetical protein